MSKNNSKYIQIIFNHLLMLVLLLFSSNSIANAGPQDFYINVNDDTKKISLGKSIQYLEDNKGSLQFTDIINSPANRNFTRSKSESLNFGFTRSAYWVSFTILNSSKKPLSFQLEVPSPLIDHVDLYSLQSDGSVEKNSAGELSPKVKSGSSGTNPLFYISLPSRTPKTYFIRFQDDGSVPFSLNLWNPNVYRLEVVKENYFFAAYFGALMLFLLYNSIVFLIIRMRSNFYYILYIANLILWQLSYKGYSTVLIWPESPWLTNHAIPFFICSTAISAIFFSRHFLNASQNAPFFDRLLQYLSIGFIITLLSTFQGNYSVSVIAAAFLALVFTVLVFLTGFICLKNGYRPARYFTVAWFFLLLGTAALGLKSFGILPSMFLTEYGQYLGSFLEVSLLSLAIIDKLYILKQEKEAAQSKSLRVQQEAKEKLELLVQERTQELTLSNQYLETLSGKLSKYLSPQVYTSIFSGKTDAVRQSYRKKLTVFFSDIVGFTDLTDTVESEDLTTVLNLYLNEMAEIALTFGGTIDKFIGDSVMVFFGDPESNGAKQDAVNCVKMALAMRNAVQVFHENPIIQEAIPFPLQIRIGINTGYCTVGNFGAENRLEYTIIGGTVNLASRLEAVAQSDQILISSTTYELVKDHVNCQITDKIKVKGIAREIQTYQVLNNVTEHEGSDVIYEKGDGYCIEVDLNKLSPTITSNLSNVMQKIQGKLSSIDN